MHVSIILVYNDNHNAHPLPSMEKLVQYHSKLGGDKVN